MNIVINAYDDVVNVLIVVQYSHSSFRHSTWFGDFRFWGENPFFGLVFGQPIKTLAHSRPGEAVSGSDWSLCVDSTDCNRTLQLST